jgi:hypothetical protein
MLRITEHALELLANREENGYTVKKIYEVTGVNRKVLYKRSKKEKKRGYVEIKVENPLLFYILKRISNIIDSFMLISCKKKKDVCPVVNSV